MNRSALLRILVFLIGSAFFSCGVYVQEKAENSFTRIDNQLAGSEESKKIIEPYRDSVQKIMNEVIGFSEQRLFTAQPQGNLGNFVCDLLLSDIPDLPRYNFLHSTTFFSLMNTRGLRAPLAAGEITRGEIFEIMPFENEIVLVKMPAASIGELAKVLLEKGGHPLSKNISFVADKNNVESFFVNNSAVTTDYWIITSDYLANGGDELSFFRSAVEVVPTGIKIRDQIITHIQQLTREGKKVNAKFDERVLFFR